MKTETNKMKTGTDVHEAGVYESECCHCEIEFSKDQTFTRCPRCSSLTRWEPLDMDDMELPLAA